MDVAGPGDEDGNERPSSGVSDVVSPELPALALKGSLDSHTDYTTTALATGKIPQVTPSESDVMDHSPCHGRALDDHSFSRLLESEESETLEEPFLVAQLTPSDSFMTDLVDFDSVLSGIGDGNAGLDSFDSMLASSEMSLPPIHLIQQPKRPSDPSRHHATDSHRDPSDDCSSRFLQVCDSHTRTNSTSSSSCHCMQNILRLHEEVETRRSASSAVAVDHCLTFQKDVLRQCRNILECMNCRSISAIAMLLITICDRLLNFCQSMSAPFVGSFHGHLRHRPFTGLVRLATAPGSDNRGHDDQRRGPKVLIGGYGVDCPQEQASLISRVIELQLRELHSLLTQLRDMAVCAGWNKHIARIHQICAQTQKDIVSLRNSSDSIVDELSVNSSDILPASYFGIDSS